MNGLSRSLFVFAVSLLIASCDRAAVEPQKARDLSRYDLAGPFSLDRSPRHADDQLALQAIIREFLWTRWRHHQLAHVSIVQYTLEGLPTRTWYFIEPDERGTWRVIIEQDETLPAFKVNSNDHMRVAHRYEAFSLDRVEQNASGGVPLAIPDDDQRPAEEYNVRFKDKSGEFIHLV
jgi:hypothetical protein